MKFKFGLFVVGFAFLFGAAAQAQERQLIDVGVSYSYVRYNPGTQGIKGFSMNGGSGSVAVTSRAGSAVSLTSAAMLGLRLRRLAAGRSQPTSLGHACL